MTDQPELAARFRALHRADPPLLLPNPWDIGSARLLGWLGFEALATTSSGSAATLGELDRALGRDRALAHAAEIVAATDLPVSADLEIGLAGFSIEDSTGHAEAPIFPWRRRSSG